MDRHRHDEIGPHLCAWHRHQGQQEHAEKGAGAEIAGGRQEPVAAGLDDGVPCGVHDCGQQNQKDQVELQAHRGS